MKNTLVSLVLSLALVAPVAAGSLTKDEMIEDFEQMMDLYQKQYGMLGWKKQHLGLDFEEMKTRYRALVEAAGSERDFYQAISAFVAEWQDPHLGFHPAEERVAFLGFSVRHVEGRAIIDRVNRKVVPESMFPFNAGDELVSIDGEAVERIVQGLKSVMTAGNERSTVSLLHRLVTVRLPSWGTFPRGNATLVIRPFGSERTITTSLPWVIRGKALPGHDGYVRAGASKNPDQDTRFLVPMASVFDRAGIRATEFAIESFDGAKVIEKKHFLALTMDSPKGPIGYIRLSSFMPPEGARKSVDRYRKVLKEMWYTKGLIVDARDNPGGSLFYGYALASLMTDRPLSTPSFSMRANRKNILEYRDWQRSAESGAEGAALANVVGALETAFGAGETMTEYIPIDGLPMVQPDPDVQYDKPILVLITELNFSMGDIWPAIMRDNERVILFGANTGGAGGAVVPTGPLTHSEADLSMTVNVVKRSNGQIVENLGVAPDIEFEYTVEDIKNGMRRYQAAFITALQLMIE